MLPTTMPNPAATESSQAITVAGVWACDPRPVSTAALPAPKSHMISRLSTIPTTTMSASARPMDFHNTARSGGESI